MRNKIAICLTTFMRDELLYKIIQSIVENITDDCILLVGDQNKEITQRIIGKNTYHYKLPFDCGLSYARNFLVKKAQEMQIKYCLITADSIQFTEKYNFEPIINFIQDDPRNGIVGFNLKNRIPWECDINLKKGKYFCLNTPQERTIWYNRIKLQRCDMLRNFFLAQTKCLIENPWDNKLKLSEHLDFFWRLKGNKIYFGDYFGEDICSAYEVYFTNYISANYVDFKPKEYNQYRQRAHQEFREIFKNKYGISGWVNYSSELKKTFAKFKRSQR